VDAGRRAGSGTALGVDLSGRLLGLGRELAAREGVTNVRFEQADAQVHPFVPGGFDVVLSRNGAMFFADQPAAFANIARGLRAGGRLTLLAWQPLEGNEWLRTFRRILGGDRVAPLPGAGRPGPMGLSDPDLVRGLLQGTGYADVRISPLSAPMYVGADVDEAYRYVSAQHGGLSDELDHTARAAAPAALRTDLAAHLGPAGVRYDSACWLIEARRAGPSTR
jgi:SAM-dependent methyltransferase